MECVLLKRRYKCERLQMDRELANLRLSEKCKQSGVIPKFLESHKELVNSLFLSLKMHIEKRHHLYISFKIHFQNILQAEIFYDISKIKV